MKKEAKKTPAKKVVKKSTYYKSFAQMKIDNDFLKSENEKLKKDFNTLSKAVIETAEHFRITCETNEAKLKEAKKIRDEQSDVIHNQKMLLLEYKNKETKRTHKLYNASSLQLIGTITEQHKEIFEKMFNKEYDAFFRLIYTCNNIKVFLEEIVIE